MKLHKFKEIINKCNASDKLEFTYYKEKKIIKISIGDKNIGVQLF